MKTGTIAAITLMVFALVAGYSFAATGSSANTGTTTQSGMDSGMSGSHGGTTGAGTSDRMNMTPGNQGTTGSGTQSNTGQGTTGSGSQGTVNQGSRGTTGTQSQGTTGTTSGSGMLALDDQGTSTDTGKQGSDQRLALGGQRAPDPDQDKSFDTTQELALEGSMDSDQESDRSIRLAFDDQDSTDSGKDYPRAIGDSSESQDVNEGYMLAEEGSMGGDNGGDFVALDDSTDDVGDTYASADGGHGGTGSSDGENGFVL